jgi:hypothetical protein
MAGIGSYKLVKFYEYVVAVNTSGNNVEVEQYRFRTFAEVKIAAVHLVLIMVITACQMKRHSR